MNPGGGGYSEPRSCYCIPARRQEQNVVSNKKKLETQHNDDTKTMTGSEITQGKCRERSRGSRSQKEEGEAVKATEK